MVIPSLIESSFRRGRKDLDKPLLPAEYSAVPLSWIKPQVLSQSKMLEDCFPRICQVSSLVLHHWEPR